MLHAIGMEDRGNCSTFVKKAIKQTAQITEVSEQF